MRRPAGYDLSYIAVGSKVRRGQARDRAGTGRCQGRDRPGTGRGQGRDRAGTGQGQGREVPEARIRRETRRDPEVTITTTRIGLGLALTVR